MKNKNDVLTEYVGMIVESWTYQKMTKEEKKRLYKTFISVQTKNALKGNYNQRWDVLQAIYNSFLNGIEYTGADWRKESDYNE